MVTAWAPIAAIIELDARVQKQRLKIFTDGEPGYLTAAGIYS
jgi:hypothetical protein